MEKKIEEIEKIIGTAILRFELLDGDRNREDVSTKVAANELREAIKIIQSLTTPSSLPTDEEIEKVFPTNNFNSGEEDSADELNTANEFRQEGAKWLRTNFSSEKDNENCVLKFIGWLFEKWDKHPDYNDVWIEIYGEEIKTISELYQIFKQEQQTTK